MPDLPLKSPIFLESSPVLQGERVSFTGILASMTHRQAMELVEQHGGVSTQHVGQATSLLVVGEEGWPLEPDGRPSSKLEQARQLCDKGEPIRIVSEAEWLKMLGIEPPERKTDQLYTPAMLSQLLNVSVNEIRRWERAGLIKAIKKVYRLPYFNLEEVTSARRLCELAASGVRADQIAASLERLRILLPNVAQPLAQLEVMARGSHGIVFRDSTGLTESTGQRIFDFDPPTPEDEAANTNFSDHEPATIPIRPSLHQGQVNRQSWSAQEWFSEGCRLSDSGMMPAAIEALRLAIVNDPLNPNYHFHLAEVLYRQHKSEAAIERYHVAVELDHNFLEAWTQLGCVLAEVHDLEGATNAFQIALDLHPDYPDAHFHLASVLAQQCQASQAESHWKCYLEFDQRGPWAEFAREQLSKQTDTPHGLD